MDRTPIMAKIRALAESVRIFPGIDLTLEQQTFERAKPKEYLQLTLELFAAICGRTIVEIGCMRQPLLHSIDVLDPRCCNDGHSTYFWGTSRANVTSVDISPGHIRVAKAGCRAQKNVRFVRSDGLKFLERTRTPIDLLFLDAWDVIPGTGYAEKHLLAYLAAKSKLSEINIVSIDDTDIGAGGKGRLLIPVLEAEGYEILVRGRQTIALFDPAARAG